MNFNKHWWHSVCALVDNFHVKLDGTIVNTIALRLLALRGLRTLRVRTRAFGPRLGEKLYRILQI